MNWEIWEQIEPVLLQYGIAPVLAVVPENQDRKLQVGPARKDFWDRVRQWQSRGWAIGLHGYQHRYVTEESGIVGISRKSEFAGLKEGEQEFKIRKAVEIFRVNGVVPQIWVAPSHSFDRATLSVLDRVGIRIVSDGFAVAPHTDISGAFWIPQQLWRFRPRPFGVWTVCYHHNHWRSEDLHRFIDDVRRYRRNISSASLIESSYRNRRNQWIDKLYSGVHHTLLVLRHQLRRTAQ